MKKWGALLLIVLATLFGYAAAGPYMAIRGIHAAIEKHDFDKLQRHVDFPALREGLRTQVKQRIAASATDASGGVTGGEAGRALIDQISGRAVDAMVSPLGIATLLQGRALAHQALGAPDGNATDPLLQAKTRFESPSRFTATVPGEEGRPVAFVFTRRGLGWKLSDIRLPDQSAPAPE